MKKPNLLSLQLWRTQLIVRVFVKRETSRFALYRASHRDNGFRDPSPFEFVHERSEIQFDHDTRISLRTLKGRITFSFVLVSGQ
jgi:hypothetical protein